MRRSPGVVVNCCNGHFAIDLWALGAPELNLDVPAHACIMRAPGHNVPNAFMGKKKGQQPSKKEP